MPRWSTGAKPDHVLEKNPATGRPIVVVETKNQQEYYLSSQIEEYLDLVGPNGKVIVAVPKSGATIYNSLRRARGVEIGPILPPK